jgi:hypothetical protein
MDTFTGTSPRGDLAEALSDALKNAAAPPHSPDVMVEWTITEISGRHGVFAGNELSVTISVQT